MSALADGSELWAAGLADREPLVDDLRLDPDQLRHSAPSSAESRRLEVPILRLDVQP